MSHALPVVAHLYEQATSRCVYRRASTTRKKGQPLVLLSDAQRSIEQAQFQPHWKPLSTLTASDSPVMLWDDTYQCIRFGTCRAMNNEKPILVIHGGSDDSVITHWATMPKGPVS